MDNNLKSPKKWKTLIKRGENSILGFQKQSKHGLGYLL